MPHPEVSWQGGEKFGMRYRLCRPAIADLSHESPCINHIDIHPRPFIMKNDD